MILIIDDDAAVRSSLTFLLKRAGFEPDAVPGPEEALAVVRRTTPQLILMDMNFTLTTTGEEGIQLLKQVKIFQPDVPVILMTAWGSISLAVQGMQAGAFDFVTKPWNNLVLLKSIRTAIELSEQKKEQETPLNRLDADNKFHFDKIIGQSAPLMEVLGTVSRDRSDQRLRPDNRRERNREGADCRGDPYEQPACEGAVCEGQPRRTFAKPFRKRDVRA